eukprot:TRINITY_DN4960_c0_g2_i11.p2 TRINITY_DN4960_c0_g2~~TRINITY_DN4960_c0_g2_i11.p2  ORF type:complete len:117 (-),score=14.34 TRINITY_DN4960_c0_g2_i11:176-526(-)
MGIESPSRKGRIVHTTLYISGIEPQFTQADLSRLFSSVSGFKSLRLTPRETGSFAFVEYTDLNAAIRAIYTLNGHPLGNTPLRIEFARNKMGEKGRSPQPNTVHRSVEGRESPISE